MLSDKFFDEFAKTGQPLQEAAAEEGAKMYTAAEVGKLVNEKVESAVKEIMDSMAANEPDIPAHEESED